MQRPRDRRFRHEGAPRRIAGIERHDVGQKLRANRRAQPVGADEEIALAAAAVGEPRGHTMRAGFDRRQLLAVVIALRRECAAQHVVEPVPRGEDLRVRPLQHQPAGEIVDAACRDTDAEVFVPGDAGGVERLLEHRMGDDAGAAPGERAMHPLVDVDVETAATQQQPGEQSGERPADDHGAARALRSGGNWRRHGRLRVPQADPSRRCRRRLRPRVTPNSLGFRRSAGYLSARQDINDTRRGGETGGHPWL